MQIIYTFTVHNNSLKLCTEISSLIQCAPLIGAALFIAPLLQMILCSDSQPIIN